MNLGASRVARYVANTGPTTFASVTAINAEGWSAAVTSPPTFNPVTTPKYVVALRAGYSATATTTTYTDNLILTQRVRQAYPSQASLDATRCAMSSYVYQTDTVTGVTNNSTVASPAPICNWATPHRLTIGTTIGAGTGFDVEVLAFHRNARSGKQVACVKFIITDGTLTTNVIVSTPTVSNRTGDQNAVIVYALPSTSISTLANGLITVNAEVYPWVGNSSSVNKSASNTSFATGSVLRNFSPRYFWKSATATTYAYVKSTGNDTTGVASTTEATAKATPCLTVIGALSKAKTATGGPIDNVVIKISDTVSVGSTFLGNLTQAGGALTVTRDPAVAQSAAIMTLDNDWEPQIVNGLTSPLTTGAIHMTDMTITRSGLHFFTGESANRLELILDNVTFNNASVAATYLSTCDDYMFGVTFQNAATAVLNVGTAEHRIFRGVSASLGTNATELWLMVGSKLTQPGPLDWLGDSLTPPTRTVDGAILAFNSYLNMSGAQNVVDAVYSTENAVMGVAFVQNLFEMTGATSNLGLRVSGDSAEAGTTTNVILHYNTWTGFFTTGRNNLFYDTTLATHRTQILQSVVGNIHCEVNTKGDQFVTDGTYIGNWAFLYAVDSPYNFTQFIDASVGGIGSAFAQAYFGLGANYGTSDTVRNDPLFTNYQGTTSGPTVGAGNGTYTVASNSPCKGMVTGPVLLYDLAGTARSLTADTAGAYA